MGIFKKKKTVAGAITFNSNTLFFYMKTDTGYAMELVIISAFYGDLIFCSTLGTFCLWNKNAMAADNLCLHLANPVCGNLCSRGKNSSSLT